MDISSIPLYKEWTNVEFIDKGWSNDKKYKVTEKTGRKLLLRVSDIKEHDRRKKEFEIMAKVYTTDIIMPFPVFFGVSNNMVYILLTYIEGDEAIESIFKLDEDIQYQLGYDAGQTLRKLHSTDYREEHALWEIWYGNKNEKILERYHNCPVKIPGDEDIIRFIETNSHYLKERPITFQHGDYHIGNMLITSDNRVGVIDFNRMGFGDPFEEYDRFIFTWEKSISFAIGQVKGYFNNIVPDLFFRLVSLYNAVNIIASIPWAIPFGKKEINTMVENAQRVYNSYEGFKTYKPIWFKD